MPRNHEGYKNSGLGRFCKVDRAAENQLPAGMYPSTDGTQVILVSRTDLQGAAAQGVDVSKVKVAARCG